MEIVFRTPFAYQVIFALQIYPRFAFIQVGRKCKYFWQDYPPGCQTLGIRLEERNINRRLKHGKHRKVRTSPADVPPAKIS